MDETKIQKNQVKKFFNRDIYWQGDIYAKDNRAYFSRLVKRRKEYVLELFNSLPKNSVNTALDIGCGAGKYMEALLQRGVSHVSGIDTSEGMLEKARQTLHDLDNWALQLGDIENIPFNKSSFELGLCIGVLPYLLEDQKALSELNRVLIPSGYLLLTASNWFCADHYHTLFKEWIKKLIGKQSLIREFQPGLSYTSPWFLNHSSGKYRFKAYNLDQLDQLMTATGFRHVDGISYGYKFPLLRRLRIIPRSLLDKLELILEKYLRHRHFFRNTGFEYIGLYQKTDV